MYTTDLVRFHLKNNELGKYYTITLPTALVTTNCEQWKLYVCFLKTMHFASLTNLET